IINQAIEDSKEYNIYLAFATGETTPKRTMKFKKYASPSKKHTLVLEEEPVKKPTRAKHPELAKKYAPAKKDVSSKKPLRKQSTSVQIRDTANVSVSKKKAPVTTDRSKGIDLLSEAALLEYAQIKKVLKWSKRENHSHQASGSGDGVSSCEEEGEQCGYCSLWREVYNRFKIEVWFCPEKAPHGYIWYCKISPCGGKL
nr:hypothetical protein [Tanacetum cinerariifolium]